MKNTVFLLIILVLFSGCDALTSPPPSNKINQFGPDPLYERPYKVYNTGFDNNNYTSDYNEDYNNRSGTSAQERNSDNRPVLVTYDIKNKLQQLRSSVDELEDMRQLKFLLSGRFNLILPVMNNGPKIDNEGAFVDRSQNTKTFNFDTTDIGRLHTIIPNAPNDKETFIISFHKHGEIILLGFKKSCYSDSYILSLANYGTEHYIISSQDGLPHLCIFMTQNILPNIEATPFSSLGNIRKRNVHPFRSGDGFHRAIMSESIISRGHINKINAISYIYFQNPAVSSQLLDSLIDTYIEEANFEGVNHDIAIAQMLYATNYLRNNISSYNYAGLSTSGARWDGRFPNMRTGVRAHIQHLKGYGSTQLPRNQIVDPRYNLLGSMQGRAGNISQLCELWSRNNNYKDNIIIILNGMYQYTY